MEKLYRLLYPMRVCLITSRHGKKENVMSASWVFPLSMDPPLFGISISSKRFSHGLIKNGRAFGINIPGPELEGAVIACGTKSGRNSDKFAETKLTKEEGLHVPLIKECQISIECEVVGEHITGDHVLFVGKAVNVKKRSKAEGLYQSEDGFVPI